MKRKTNITRRRAASIKSWRTRKLMKKMRKTRRELDELLRPFLTAEFIEGSQGYTRALPNPFLELK